MSTVLAGLGLVFFTFGIPYLVYQLARTRRQRAALMFFGVGTVVSFVIAVGAQFPSRFADSGPGFGVLEALILPSASRCLPCRSSFFISPIASDGTRQCDRIGGGRCSRASSGNRDSASSRSAISTAGAARVGSASFARGPLEVSSAMVPCTSFGRLLCA